MICDVRVLSRTDILASAPTAVKLAIGFCFYGLLLKVPDAFSFVRKTDLNKRKAGTQALKRERELGIPEFGTEQIRTITAVHAFLF